jgi:hypothetical protein
VLFLAAHLQVSYHVAPLEEARAARVLEPTLALRFVAHLEVFGQLDIRVEADVTTQTLACVRARLKGQAFGGGAARALVLLGAGGVVNQSSTFDKLSTGRV